MFSYENRQNVYQLVLILLNYNYNLIMATPIFDTNSKNMELVDQIYSNNKKGRY